MSMWSISQYLARAEDPPRNKECGAHRHETSTIPTKGSRPHLSSAILNSPSSAPNSIFAVVTWPVQISRTQTSARLLRAALPQHLLLSFIDNSLIAFLFKVIKGQGLMSPRLASNSSASQILRSTDMCHYVRLSVESFILFLCM